MRTLGVGREERTFQPSNVWLGDCKIGVYNDSFWFLKAKKCIIIAFNYINKRL